MTVTIATSVPEKGSFLAINNYTPYVGAKDGKLGIGIFGLDANGSTYIKTSWHEPRNAGKLIQMWKAAHILRFVRRVDKNNETDRNVLLVCFSIASRTMAPTDGQNIFGNLTVQDVRELAKKCPEKDELLSMLEIIRKNRICIDKGELYPFNGQYKIPVELLNGINEVNKISKLTFTPSRRITAPAYYPQKSYKNSNGRSDQLVP